jgi:hypothetical protein
VRCYRSRFRKTKALAVPDSAGALILSARKEGFMSTTQSHVDCGILVEAEEFEDFGGWTLDSQFGLRAPILIADETLEHEGSRDGKKMTQSGQWNSTSLSTATWGKALKERGGRSRRRVQIGDRRHTIDQ